MLDVFESTQSGTKLNGKRRGPTLDKGEPSQKRAKQLLTDDSSSSSEDNSSGGAPLPTKLLDSNLTVNEDFARRFEHNKRREELQRLEERFGKGPTDGKHRVGAGSSVDTSDSPSDSEEEDDEGDLASGNLDEQFQATLRAIQAKDPRVYDKSSVFYSPSDEDNEHKRIKQSKRDKPLHLSDYHRRNILDGITAVDGSEDAPTYMQQQDEMKNTILQEIHATAVADSQGGPDNFDHDSSEEEQRDDFLIPKAPSNKPLSNHVQVAAVPTAVPDVEKAEEDPEKFLSEFISSRAWVPHTTSQSQPFESDDEDEDKRADDFEEAYNLRFENPGTSNERLISHARDAAARYSVRRETMTGRKKAREIERAKRRTEKEDRDEEKARLRKLRIADAEEKVKRIKEAAGFGNEHLNLDDWSRFLEEGWDVKRWDEEMLKRFGDTYYAEHDGEKVGDEQTMVKAKIKKPKWKDDIDIHDLVPDFEEADSQQAKFELSDVESDNGRLLGETRTSKPLSRRRKSRDKDERQRQARQERRRIEQLVDQDLNADDKLAETGRKHSSVFKYRETSPVGYGLTAQDILMASDSQLNQYAGLKKLAAYRDSARKAKDRRRLGKKARLRQWRKETFGNELQGPPKTLGEIIAIQGVERSEEAGKALDVERRKRSRNKSQVTIG
ncbi:MAG: hypothetical protein Q9219_003096 [cf. Caloplaca sp. 3 TL-2023]